VNFTVRPANENDRPWMLEIIRGWGADFIVSRGRKIYAAELPAFIAESIPASDSWAADVPVCPSSEDQQTSGRRGRLPATERVDGVDRNQTAGGGRFRQSSGEKVGLLTYEIIGDQCEVVTLDAFTQFSGVGTALMQHAIDAARSAGCRRIWLITTNDNLDAIRFYQKRGFTIAAVHVNAIAHSRTLKPSIPLVGNYGIPIRDEVELEMGV